MWSRCSGPKPKALRALGLLATRAASVESRRSVAPGPCAAVAATRCARPASPFGAGIHGFFCAGGCSAGKFFSSLAFLALEAAFARRGLCSDCFTAQRARSLIIETVNSQSNHNREAGASCKSPARLAGNAPLGCPKNRIDISYFRGLRGRQLGVGLSPARRASISPSAGEVCRYQIDAVSF